MSENEPELTVEESREIAIRGLLKGIPWIGSTLAEFYSGPAQELRTKRVEETLKEIGEKLKELGKKIESIEEFANLLESVAPDLGRTTNEEKRKYFRNLLFKASTLPPNSPGWDDTNLARQLLEEVDVPGILIISAIAHCRTTQGAYLLQTPVPHFTTNAYVKHGIMISGEQSPKNPIHCNWRVVVEWIQRLTEKRLITYSAIDDIHIVGVKLTQFGDHFARWTTSGEFEAE